MNDQQMIKNKIIKKGLTVFDRYDKIIKSLKEVTKKSKDFKKD